MSEHTHTDASGVEHVESADAAAAVQEERAGAIVARDEHGEIETHYANPGLAPHIYRRSDIDQKAAQRREREVATLFGLSTLGTLIFIVSYFVFKPADKQGNSNQLLSTVHYSTLGLGLGMGIALFCIGAGAIHWAKTLMPDDEIVQERKPMRSSDEERAAAVEAIKEGAAGAGLGRRKLIRNSLLGAMAPLGLMALVPLRDLGPLPGASLAYTAWRKGIRLVSDPSRNPIKAEEVPIGGVVHVMPEGIDKMPNPLDEEAKAAAIVIRLAPDELHERPDRKGWDYNGIVCYSKICTHVGCPVGLYEQQTHHLLCPCHQSTFDVTRNCEVVFGPAGRPLPQLKISVDSEGYLVADQDFQEPIGPSFWERGKN
jgi:ubiquinol-cytochrome c reductase iron-sulfur subunit